MARYELQRLIDYDPKTKMETWRKVSESDDLETLKEFLGHGYRILDKGDGSSGIQILRSEVE